MAQTPPINVSRLPLDLAKVTTTLRQEAESPTHGLRLRYRVEVYGQAPKIVLFDKRDNLSTGPAPYGAPSHREMIEHVTPLEYRAPALDFSALIRWLNDKTNGK
mgnify:CR=1 FL=1